MNNDFESYPIRSSIDNALLMHREVHFGGSFPIMIDYYEKGGKGIQNEFDLSRIRSLAEIEQTTEKNLAPLYLTGPEVEKVARAKEAYRRLRALYEEEETRSNPFPLLIADLILAEEQMPENEIAAIVKEKGAIVPSLIELLHAEDFYDPLFPGYGQAPMLAAHCLGRIGDKRAIISLFETIGEEDVFNEDLILEALRLIGEPAKQFLMKVVQGRPINFDNERAAVALLQFKEDPAVGELCINLLYTPDVKKDIPLATYLMLACENLKNETQRHRFLSLLEDSSFPKVLHQDIKMISKNWST
jgi:hypothetical protein